MNNRLVVCNNKICTPGDYSSCPCIHSAWYINWVIELFPKIPVSDTFFLVQSMETDCIHTISRKTKTSFNINVTVAASDKSEITINVVRAIYK